MNWKKEQTMAEIFGFDAYSPKEIAERVETIGVVKARLPFLPQMGLGILAGGFIGLGALYSTLITSDPHLSFGIARLLGGLTFSLGLILVVVSGAELFTGNNLLVMAWMSKKISTFELLKNWFIIFGTNLIGALGLVMVVVFANHGAMNGGGIGAQAVKIATTKVSLPFWEALFKGVLCNILVCLAVWMAIAGRSVTDKAMAIVFPISAFVAAGFEHSVANMYFIPLGILLRDRFAPQGLANVEQLNWLGFLHNLIPVSLGNIFGGGVMVALVYYIIYLRGAKRT
jgi:formate/nitrite transporter